MFAFYKRSDKLYKLYDHQDDWRVKGIGGMLMPQTRPVMIGWPDRLQKVRRSLPGQCADVHRPPLFAGPGFCETRIQQELFSSDAVAIPGELAFDPAVFIGPDFFVGLAHHNRGLRPLHQRLGGEPRRPVGLLGVNSRDVAPIRFARAGCFRNRFVVIRFKPVNGGDDQVLAVLIITRALSQAEQIAS